MSIERRIEKTLCRSPIVLVHQCTPSNAPPRLSYPRVHQCITTPVLPLLSVSLGASFLTPLASSRNYSNLGKESEEAIRGQRPRTPRLCYTAFRLIYTP